MFSSVLVEGANLKTILYLSMNVLQGYNYENHFIAVSQRWKGSSEKNKLKSQWILIMSFLKIENYFYYFFIECLFRKEK